MCSLIKGDSDSDSGQLRTALSAEAEHAVLVAGCAVAWMSYALDCLQDCVCGVNGQIVRAMPESIYAPLFSDALVTHPSRLETRTKEFSMQASLRVKQNPKAK
jgi:hypothetical protein